MMGWDGRYSQLLSQLCLINHPSTHMVPDQESSLIPRIYPRHSGQESHGLVFPCNLAVPVKSSLLTKILLIQEVSRLDRAFIPPGDSLLFLIELVAYPKKQNQSSTLPLSIYIHSKSSNKQISLRCKYTNSKEPNLPTHSAANRTHRSINAISHPCPSTSEIRKTEAKNPYLTNPKKTQKPCLSIPSEPPNLTNPTHLEQQIQIKQHSDLKWDEPKTRRDKRRALHLHAGICMRPFCRADGFFFFSSVVWFGG